MAARNEKGRFCNQKPVGKRKVRGISKVILDHNYCGSKACMGQDCVIPNCQADYHIELPKGAKRSEWKCGRRVVELGYLLSNLRSCAECRLGPVGLTYDSVVGELRKGLSGYLYVRCQNPECLHINRVTYGKTHRLKKRGMPCFAANTKLGVAMIDSLGGHGKVNNMLSTLNLGPIHRRNLQTIERRAGEFVESVAKQSLDSAAKDAFEKEMSEISQEESQTAAAGMDDLIEDLGVAALPDASPASKSVVKHFPNSAVRLVASPQTPGSPARQRRRKFRCLTKGRTATSSSRKSLQMQPKHRYGMSCAADTGWQKRGFDSLTSHTFFMSTAKRGKRVLKSIVSHKQCSTCSWWRRQRPGQPVRPHRCVRNHTGSARSMESESGVRAVLELAETGTPVEYIEGDGDNTLLARLKADHNISMKKRFDKNHVIKNFGKSLYVLRNEKGVKISKNTICHIQKCVSYALSKNSGDIDGLRNNLQAIVPHNFGDHQLCNQSFCGQLRNKDLDYVHRSLPYKSCLTGETLKQKLDDIMAPLISKVNQLVDLGSSQQCEHANREVSLKAPKNIYYGGTEALDFRVQATAAFINEGRNCILEAVIPFIDLASSDDQDQIASIGAVRVPCCHSMLFSITEVNKAASLSPGKYTQAYAETCARKRQKQQMMSCQPSAKRRRLILKQERAVNQSATEALEGTTYQSGVGHHDDVDISKVPDPVPRGVFKPVSPSGETSYIAFDLETTDLIRGDQYPHITQIAAKELNSGKCFNRYVIPKTPIAASAERITKIIMTSETEMIVDKIPVECVVIQEALDDFYKWLSQFENILLVAHNGRRFDFPVIVTASVATSTLEQLCSCVTGFVDSIPVFKTAYPGRQTYSQESLVHSVLEKDYNAHNAADDVQCLLELLSVVLSQCKNCIIVKSFTPLDVKHSMDSNREKKKNLPSFSPLIVKGIMKRTTAENIASSGLKVEHLRTIFTRDGEDGLYNVFTMKNSEGLPRVTSAKRTLESVIPKLVSFFDNKESQ